MGGLFDDIFEDDDFEIAGEVEEELELDDDWNAGPDRQKSGTWDSGQKQDIWNADEPWTTDCDDDCDPKSDCSGCSGDPKPGFDVDDWFR